MTASSPSRRDLLKGAAAITAATAVGIGGATTRRAHAQTPSAPPARIDPVLKQAVDTREVRGVVAMAATDKGLFYEGACGVRELAKGPDRTHDSVCRFSP